ncbi:LuxR C-terminal-related transcriptional regulator [Paenarthrobacter sp. NPDC092416]|uniref:LuxR C-terminal-related transcriptional regulator n=1 Tax=Paenarthrobacter sp. NPDC092416 TaxID=3364386 RepID=UPI0038222D6A
MSQELQQLSEARDAYARGEWGVARRGLELAGQDAPLSSGDLEILSRSAWWLGDVQSSMSLSEQIFHRLADEHQHQAAARTALTLSLQWGVRGNLAVSSAWLNRARRLLEDLPEVPEHGYLLYVEGNDALNLEGDPGPALASSVRLKEMSQRHDAPELEGFAHLLAGLAAVRTGQASRGFQELDEAMLPVMAGQVPAEWGGDIYCSVIHLCYEMADFARMRAWTDALSTWCAGLSESFMYTGIAHVHELQLLSAEGNWARVEAEMPREAERLRNAQSWIAADGYCELGEIRRRRGNATGAEAAFALACGLGVDAQPGRALLQADSGMTEAAVEALRGALADRGTLGRARLLLPLVELLAPREPGAAAAHCTELERTAAFYGTPGFQAWAHQARGALMMAERRWPEALVELEAAARSYRSLRMRYELSRVHERLASVRAALGEPGVAEAERATAAAIRNQLGAVNVSWETATKAPGGLTLREVEVLRCVLAGASNRQIANALTISEKTAGRHLANIFTKIGVSSRTAAAAWAHQHGLAERPEA